MTVHNNYPYNFIDNPEDFASISYDSYVNTIDPTSKQVSPRLAIHN